MTDASDRPAPSGPTGSPSASPRSGGSRNRRRRGGGGGGAGGGTGGGASGSASRGASGGGGGGGSSSGSSGRGRSGASGGSGSGGSGGGRSGQSRSGGGGNRNGGGNRSGGGNRGGDGSRGGQNRPTSGGRGPSGRGGDRQGPVGGNRSGGSSGNGSERTAVPAPIARVDRGVETAEETAAAANRRRALLLSLVPSAVLGVVVAAVLVAVGQVIVALAALVFVSAAGAAWLWRTAPGTVLDALGAVPSRESDRPRLHNLVDGLCATMGLERPSIAVVDSDVPNALAVGRDPKSATLVVTSGLDRALTLVELEGVLAHELVHIKRNDTVLSAVAVLVAVPWAVVRGTPAGVDAVHGLVGRGREFSADQRAALVVRYPPGIGSALGTMVGGPRVATAWPPSTGRVAALTRWLWVDPMAGATDAESLVGNLDDTRVRAAALDLG